MTNRDHLDLYQAYERAHDAAEFAFRHWRATPPPSERAAERLASSALPSDASLR